MSSFTIRACFAVVAALAALSMAGCSSETPQEMLKRARTDTELSDADAVQLMAKAIFDSAETSSELTSDGKVLATISVHGEDESGLPPSVIDTAQGGINNVMKKIQLMSFVPDFARFVEYARARNLGEVVITIQTATFSGGGIDDWVDTYRLRLPGDRFDAFLQAAKLDIDKRTAAAEQTWTVEFDAFDQFTYTK